MVELVDTQDLKYCSRKRSAGSIPALSTKALIHVRIRALFFIPFYFGSLKTTGIVHPKSETSDKEENDLQGISCAARSCSKSS